MSKKPGKSPQPTSFGALLTPIMFLALATATVSWTAAWFFREQFEFSATLVGIGCLPIVIAIIGYLLMLLKKLDTN
jgi:uncharacterized membrane protein